MTHHHGREQRIRGEMRNLRSTPGANTEPRQNGGLSAEGLRESTNCEKARRTVAAHTGLWEETELRARQELWERDSVGKDAACIPGPSLPFPRALLWGSGRGLAVVLSHAPSSEVIPPLRLHGHSFSCWDYMAIIHGHTSAFHRAR